MGRNALTWRPWVLVGAVLSAGMLTLASGCSGGAASVAADQPEESALTASPGPQPGDAAESEDVVESEPEPGDAAESEDVVESEPEPGDAAESDDVAEPEPEDPADEEAPVDSIARAVDRWAEMQWGESPPAPDVAAIAALVYAMDSYGPDCSWQAERVVGNEHWSYCRVGSHWERIGFSSTSPLDPDDPDEGERFVSEHFTLFGGELIGASESDVGYRSWNVPYYIVGDKPVLGPSLGHGKTEDEEWDPVEIFDQWTNRQVAYDTLRNDATAVDGIDGWQDESAPERSSELLTVFSAAGDEWTDGERPSVDIVAYAAIVDSFVEAPTCLRTVEEVIGDETWTYCQTSPTLELLTIEADTAVETYVVQAGRLIGLIEQGSDGSSASSYVAGCQIVSMRTSGPDVQPVDAIERWNDRRQWVELARAE